MHFKAYLSAAVIGLPALAAANPDPFQVYTISSKDITAKFIPFGARLISLLVPDRKGAIQDVVVGYDNPLDYLRETGPNHTYFGPVVGRYANRIKNGTFTIDGQTFHIPENDHGGLDTLHGGPVGYDLRNWTVVESSPTSLTFTFLDKGLENFPGDVVTYATYTVDTEVSHTNPKGRPQLTTRLVSLALTKKTPIMLANHVYWNLNGFREPTIAADFLQMPFADRWIGTDGNLIPNGTLPSVLTHKVWDFISGKPIGQDFDKALGVCGTNCTGYDTCFINDVTGRAAKQPVVPVLHMFSPATGITLDVATNQPALQIYTCNGQNGTIPVKPSQIARNKAAGFGGVNFVNKHGCIVIETEGWIDAINQPEFGQNQIYGPTSTPTLNFATYQFGTQ